MFYQINVMDEVSPFIRELLRNNKTFFRRATKSLGWWITDETKKEIAKGAPGGVAFKTRTPWKRVRSSIANARNRKASTRWYGQIRRAFGYEYHDGVVDIGWYSRTAAMYGNMQEAGFRTHITNKMRILYQKADVPLSGKKEIETPARPIWRPATRDKFPKIPGYLDNKVTEYLEGGVEFGKKKREYKVYK